MELRSLEIWSPEYGIFSANYDLLVLLFSISQIVCMYAFWVGKKQQYFHSRMKMSLSIMLRIEQWTVQAPLGYVRYFLNTIVYKALAPFKYSQLLSMGPGYGHHN